MFTRKCFVLHFGLSLLFVCLLNVSKTYAQCSCYDCPILLPDNVNTPYVGETIVINSTNNTLGVDNSLEQVCLAIEHTYVGDLDITLTAPDGTSVILYADGNNDISLGGSETAPFGNSGENFNLCFVTPGNASNIFGSGASCTSSTYQDPCNGADPPCYDGVWGTYDEGCQGGMGLDAFNNGTGTVSGTWTLTVNDNAPVDDGILWNFSLVFTTPPDSCATMAPPVPALCGNTTQVTIPDAGPAVTSVITNTGSVGNMGAGTEIVSVCVLIDHNWLSDLDLYLTEPDGTQIELSTDNGGSGDDYGNMFTGTEVCFTPNAPSSITGYVGGSTNDYTPEQSFSIFDGPANGNWTLSVQDDAGLFSGTIESWSILFGNGDCAYDCVYSYSISDAFCSGETYLFGGNILTTGGTYYDTIAVGGGCDSVVTLTLTQVASSLTTFNAVMCPGDTITVNGVDYTTAGTFYDTLTNVNNCDSVIQVKINLSPYAPFKGIYAGDYSNYHKLNPYTGALQSTVTPSPITGGWVNAAFTIREAQARIYWITDQLNLHSVNLVSGAETSVACGIASLPFFWSLKYYNGFLYTLSTSGDGDKTLVRFNPSTGAQDGSFTPIEINGTAAYNVSMGSSPVVNPITGLYYIPLTNNVMLEFDIAGGTGSVINLSGALSTPGYIELLEIDEYTGDMYALTDQSNVVQVTKTGPGAATVSLIKSLASATGYVNPASTFDADNKLYIFQAESGCYGNPLVAVDVTNGNEYCSDPPGTVYAHLESLNCTPSTVLRYEDPDEPGEGDGPRPETVPIKEQEFEVRVFPNPVHDFMHLRVSVPEAGNVYMRIMDLSGNIRQEKVHEADHGWNTFKVTFEDLGTGVYFLEVHAGKYRFIEKIVKQ